MLRKWRVENFKSIRATTEIEFGGITLMTGANSSGKSSIIQSLLAATQTVTVQQADDPIVLNGSLVRLGGLADVRSQASGQRSIAIGLSVDLGSKRRNFSRSAQPSGLASLDVHLSADPGTGAPRIDALDVGLSGKVQHPLRAKRGRLGGIEDERPVAVGVLRRRLPVWRLKVDLKEPSAEAAPTRTARPGGRAFRLRPLTQVVGLQVQGFVPVGVAVEEDEGVVAADEAIQYLRDANPFFGSYERTYSPAFSSRLVTELALMGIQRARPPKSARAIVTATSRLNRTQRLELAARLQAALLEAPNEFASHQTRLSVTPLPPLVEEAVESVLEVLSEGIRYLGPLRADPRATYDMPPTDQRADVGLKGEFTAAVLHRHRDQTVAHVLPTTMQRTRQSLRAAVDVWLSHLGLVQNVSPSAPSRFGHQLLLTVSGLKKPLDPTYVGVGVSQVLPVLVQGLLTPPGGVLVLEQPELHLHPDVQADLGDFLIALQETQRQVVLETHSEHLVNRIRLRVAQGRMPATSVSIYFATLQDAGSRFQKLDLTDAGSLTAWPRGFLDRAARDAEELVRANLSKKK